MAPLHHPLPTPSPHQLELLRTKLAIGVELGQARAEELLGQLDAAVACHLALVAADSERLVPRAPQPPPQEGLDGMGLFLMGA